MEHEANKAVIRRWVEAGNDHDLDAYYEIFAEDTYDNVGQRRGVEWWKEVFGFLYVSFPDWQWTLEDLVAEGDRVVARLTMRGTHQASAVPFLRGIQPTGKAVVWTHHHTFRLAHGKVVEHWANRDDLGLLRQITDE